MCVCVTGISGYRNLIVTQLIGPLHCHNLLIDWFSHSKRCGAPTAMLAHRSTGQDQAAAIKRQLYLLMPDSSVFLDVDDSVLAVAEPLRGVVATQSLDEQVGVTADLLGELDDIDAFQDDVVRLHGIRAREWRAGIVQTLLYCPIAWEFEFWQFFHIICRCRVFGTLVLYKQHW